MDHIDTAVREVSADLERLLERFGFTFKDSDDSPALAAPVIREALERTAYRTVCRNCNGEKCTTHFDTEVRRIVLHREYLKVVCGRVFGEDVRRASRDLSSDPEETRASLERYQTVQGMLSPHDAADHKSCTRVDPGSYFDPRSWNVSAVSVTTPSMRYVRLALFVEAMLDQELGLQDSETTIQEAAERVIIDRAQHLNDFSATRHMRLHE